MNNGIKVYWWWIGGDFAPNRYIVVDCMPSIEHCFYLRRSVKSDTGVQLVPVKHMMSHLGGCIDRSMELPEHIEQEVLDLAKVAFDPFISIGSGMIVRTSKELKALVHENIRAR